MSDNTQQGSKILSGVFWSFGERICAQLVTFIVSIVLARILLPEDYGTVTMILVFITIANVFVSNGFGESLIQKKNSDEVDFSTIFWTSFAVSIVLYLILFICAPFIADFYRTPELCVLLRVFAIKLPISSLSTIQHAYVSKHMQFKKFFFSTLIGTVISGVIGIAMAYNGFGVWSIVCQYLINTSVDTIVLLFTVPWRPQFIYSKASAKVLMKFGWKMTLSALINETYSEIRPLLIGKFYTKDELAQYKRGAQFPQLFITNINSAIGAVLFPSMSKVNGDIVKLKELTRKSMRMTSYMIFPLMTGLFIVAQPLVIILLTEKWLPCVPFLRLACISFACQPIQTANCQAIKALGRSGVYLWMEVIKKTVGISVLLFVMHEGVRAIAISEVFVVLFSVLVSVAPNSKLIKYTPLEQVKDLIPYILMCLVMGLTVFSLTLITLSPIVLFFSQVITGIIIYVLLSKLFKIEEYYYLKGIVRKLLQGRRNGTQKGI